MEERLDLQIAALRAQTLAPNTQKTYGSQLRLYTAFCADLGYRPVPAAPETLSRYIAFLTDRIKYRSIRCYLSAVRILHLEMGHPNPLEDSWFLSSLLKGVRRTLGDPTAPKKPITPDILLHIRAQLDFSKPLDVVFWAAALLMFFTLLRKSNVFPPSRAGFKPALHLCRRDIKIVGPPGHQSLVVTSRRSKTIQFMERHLETPLPFLPGHPLCPTTAVCAAFAASLPARPDDPAFTTRGPKGPIPLLYGGFLARLKQVLASLPGGAKDYAAHSFRRGGASWALQQGIPGEVIRVLGDWQSLAYLSYLSVPLTIRHQAMDTFASNLPTTLDPWSQ